MEFFCESNFQNLNQVSHSFHIILYVSFFSTVFVEDRIGTEQSFVKPLKLYINRPFLYYLTTDSVIAFIGRLNTESSILPSKVETATLEGVTTPLLESASTSRNEIEKNILADVSSTPEVPNPPEVDTSIVATTLKGKTTPKSVTQAKNKIVEK